MKRETPITVRPGVKLVPKSERLNILRTVDRIIALVCCCLITLKSFDIGRASVGNTLYRGPGVCYR